MIDFRMNKFAAFTAPALVLLASSTADTPAPRSANAPQEAAISLSIMQGVTRTLSSDAFEGREPGTAGEGLTVNYLVEQFTAAGLQAGNGGSWFQDVPLVEITARDIAPLTIAGGAQDIAFDFGDDWVGVSYRETPRIDLADSEIVFVGYGINAPEKGWNDYEGIDMRGKTALILVNDPDFEMEGLDGPFNGRAMTYYGRWTYKFEEAARQGAAAAIIVHDTFPASYGWNVVEGGWSGAQAYAGRTDGGADQTLMNGWVQLAVAEQITDAAGIDLATLMTVAKDPGFRAVPLGLTASTSFGHDIRTFNSRNVIGILPGTTRPDEYVLHTAHWDHLGRCNANEAGDDICNGAVDNATGVAALVALADAHVTAGATERTQVFLAVTAEESGLLGSEYYGANPVFPLAQTAGGVNIDALYMMGEARDVVSIGSGKSTLDGYVARALAQTGRVLTADDAPQAGRYYRSDHFSLAKRGVPMIYLKPGHDLLDGGIAEGLRLSAAYTANAYHGPEDEYDPTWDWRGVMRDLQLYFAISRMIGNTDEWPNWYETDEFRMIRDGDCAPVGGC